MQAQIHKIIKTDANICFANSENKYTDKNDSRRLHRADGIREEETVAATTELSLFMSRCIKP